MVSLDGIFNKSNLMDKFFKKVDESVWDLSTGKIGLITKDGIATISGEGDSAAISTNPIEQFGIPLPSFARSTALTDVKVGDLIYGTTAATKGWVVEIKVSDNTDGSKNYKFVILTPSGVQHTFTPPKVQLFGIAPNGVMIVQNLLNITGTDGLSDMKNSLLPLIMMGGNLDEIGDMLPMLMMGGLGGGSGNAGQMLQTMMMMKMMNGNRSETKRTGRTGSSYFEDR